MPPLPLAMPKRPPKLQKPVSIPRQDLEETVVFSIASPDPKQFGSLSSHQQHGEDSASSSSSSSSSALALNSSLRGGRSTRTRAENLYARVCVDNLSGKVYLLSKDLNTLDVFDPETAKYKRVDLSGEMIDAIGDMTWCVASCCVHIFLVLYR